MADVAPPPDLKVVLRQMIARGQVTDALAACVQGRGEAAQDADLAALHAYLLLRVGARTAAAEVARQALQLGTQDWLAHAVLGKAETALGRAAEASVAFREAHRRAPHNVEMARSYLTETAAAFGVAAAAAAWRDISRANRNPGLALDWAHMAFAGGEAPGAGFAVRPLMSVSRWMAANGLQMAWVGEAEDIPVSDPEMLGGPPTVQLHSIVRGYIPYVAALPDAVALAKSNIVLAADGAALNDTAADPAYGRYLAHDSDPAVLARRGDDLLLQLGPYEEITRGAAVSLLGAASEHFGHWVPEFLFKLAYLERFNGFEALPILIDADMPPSHIDYLQRLTSNPLEVVAARTAVRCETLVVAAPSTFFPIHLVEGHQAPLAVHGPFSPRALRRLRAGVLDGAPPPARIDRRLFLSRRTRSWRLLSNEDEVAAFLAEFDFEIVSPEALSFDEQVAMFREAEAIVAPNGSAWINLIFSEPGVKALVLSQPEFFSFNGFVGPMRALGYDPIFVAGDQHSPGLKHASYRVPIERIAEGLDRLGVRRRPGAAQASAGAP